MVRTHGWTILGLTSTGSQVGSRVLASSEAHSLSRMYDSVSMRFECIVLSIVRI